ncbi:oligoendopeptidase F [Paenibacillus antarcticus]|uniref:Oligopeptidase F n=1 Tax=Paenibacillus antarcticus TaxID=253703 RepID=A0A168MYT9_9BACL|nr:oligoendopeptidase F [Paenibacillus antarcticus]OAB45202.1 oligoendopeptidase F [Paenibacillus antarcticus]
MGKIMKRSEVLKETTWNLDDIFTSVEAWDIELKSIREDVESVTQYKGRLIEGSETLLACLNAREELQRRVSRAATFAHLRQTEDGTNPDHLVNSAKSGDMVSNIASQLSFINSEIIALPDGTVERFLEENAGLSDYRRSIHLLLKTKSHRLSSETESVLASMSEVFNAPYRVYLRAKLSDMTFENATDEGGNSLPVSFPLYENTYEQSPDTTLRRSGFASFSRSLRTYQNTFAEAYATEVKKQVIISRLRGYESVTEMLLQPQQVTTQMYNQVMDTILEQLAPHMRRFANLKKRELGLDHMYFADLKAPLDPEFSPSTTYSEACQLIQDALGILGSEYGEIVNSAFNERWVDYANNAGKSTGAFCSSAYGEHSYILMTWADNMRGAFTLAHEVGHAGHLMLAARNQRLTNARPSMYFIEAPSTLNELLLAEHLMANSDDNRMKRWVILQLLNTYYHNFVTHLLEGELQRRVYRLAMNDEPITARVLSELKGEILTSFWGEAVEIEEDAKLTWMRQPHYYMGLYPYTYAAGLSASTAVVQIIREEGQPAIDRWLEVLEAGGSMTPLELMKLAGVDMSDENPIISAVNYVGSLIDQLESLY